VTDTVLLPGGRDVRGTLDGPEDAPAAIVACPPHPEHGGRRTDRRLRAVSDRLAAENVACLRFDYGEWDEGRGERADARAGVRWATDRYDRVGLFGFSFGGSMALLAGADCAADLAAVVALAPAAQVGQADVPAALEDAVDAAVPVGVVYGTRDTTADWEPVVERARDLGCPTVEIEGDHFFVGQHESVAESVVGLFDPVVEG